MKIYDKFLKKYANEVLLPPPPEEVIEERIVPDFKMAPLPQIADPSEQEMRDWEDFIAQKKLLKDLEKTKEITDLGGEEKAKKEEGTVPAIPRKKAYIDQILARCDLYCKLANK